MATNTLGTLASTKVVMEIMSTMLAMFPAFRRITHDFTASDAKWLQPVTSRVVLPRTAVDFDPAVGYVGADSVIIDVPITMNKHPHMSIEVSDIEQSQTSRNLREELVVTNAHGLGTKFMNDLFATVTAAAYPLSYESSGANFDATDIRKIGTKLNQNFAPPLNRFALLNSEFVEGVDLDTVIIANPNGAFQNQIKNPAPEKQVHGFDTSEYSALPAGGEKLAGIAGNKEAIICASRVPDVPASPGEIPGTIRNVTEPNTGLTVQMRRYYDMKLGKLTESLTLMYGFAVGLSELGVSKRLVRIVTP